MQLNQIRVSAKALAEVRKKYNIKANESIPAHIFREAMSISVPTKETKNRNFNFNVKILYITNNEISLEVIGDIMSKNQIDSLGRKDVIRFKKSIKKAFDDFYLSSKKDLSIFTSTKYPNKYEIGFVFGVKRLRDWDNNQEVIKKIQDGIVRIGLIKDDNPNVLRLQKDGIKQVKISNKEKNFVHIKLRRS